MQELAAHTVPLSDPGSDRVRVLIVNDSAVVRGEHAIKTDQDKETGVVWAMPGSVATNALCSAFLPLSRMAGYVSNFSKRKTP